MKIEELQLELYESWRKHPITAEVMKVLVQHRDSFVKELVTLAGNASVEDKQFRNLSYGLRTVHSIIQAISDFESFKQQLNKTNK